MSTMMNTIDTITVTEADVTAPGHPARPAATVTEALSRVMAELPGIGKDERADPRSGGYAYRGIEAITRQVQPLLARHGVVFAPHVHNHEVIDIEVNGKPWTDTRLLVSYSVFGPGGPADRIEVGPILAIGRDNADKGANKCMTQAFKYLLLQLLCVSDSKDDADAASVEADGNVACASVLPSSGKNAVKPNGSNQDIPLPEGWFSFEDCQQAHNNFITSLNGLTETQVQEIRSLKNELTGTTWPTTPTILEQLTAAVKLYG